MQCWAEAVPVMLFSKYPRQSGILLGTSRPNGPADLPSVWASRKAACQNWSRKRFLCSEAMLPMIASVLGGSAYGHRFRFSEAVLPMARCHHTQHCFKKAMAWTKQDVCFSKPCPNPMGGATNPWDASGDERCMDLGGLFGAWLTIPFP